MFFFVFRIAKQSRYWQFVWYKIQNTLFISWLLFYFNLANEANFAGGADGEKARDLSVCGACCKTDVAMSLCGACKEVAYCGRACQRAHWNVHKVTCKKNWRGSHLCFVIVSLWRHGDEIFFWFDISSGEEGLFLFASRRWTRFMAGNYRQIPGLWTVPSFFSLTVAPFGKLMINRWTRTNSLISKVF